MVQGMPYDYTIDIWALGILLFEMVAGVAPFRGESPEEVLAEMKRSITFSEKFGTHWLTQRRNRSTSSKTYSESIPASVPALPTFSNTRILNLKNYVLKKCTLKGHWIEIVRARKVCIPPTQPKMSIE